MKRLYFDRIASAVAVVLWMAVIFWFSAQNGSSSGSMSAGVTEALARLLTPGFDELSPLAQAETVEALHLFVRKAAHFSEYAVLGMLTVNALRTYRLNKALRLILPVATCLVYAVSDEIHQYFIPDRACRAFDVFIDTMGGLTGTLILLGLMWLIKRRRKRKELKNDKENNR